jgi:hypothetical protein
VSSPLTNYQAVIDVVTFIDGTAEATINDALGRIVDERQATVASQKIITEIIQTALADPNDTDPSVTVAKEIQDRATIWKAQQHAKIDLDPVRLESRADELKTVFSRNANKRDAQTDRKQGRGPDVHMGSPCGGRKGWRSAMTYILRFAFFAVLLAATTRFSVTCVLTVGILCL